MHTMFDFTRRINRKTYFAAYISTVVLILGILVLAGLSDSLQKGSAAEGIVMAGVFIGILATSLYSLCLAKQRANDISGNKTYLYLLLSIFLIGCLIGFFPGEKKANKYGPVPELGVNLG